MSDNPELETKVAVLQTEMSYIKQSLNKIENNHLVHLQAGIDKVSEQLDKQAAMCHEIQACKATANKVDVTHHMDGKTKVALLGAFLTAFTAIVVELIRGLI